MNEYRARYLIWCYLTLCFFQIIGFISFVVGFSFHFAYGDNTFMILAAFIFSFTYILMCVIGLNLRFRCKVENSINFKKLVRFFYIPFLQLNIKRAILFLKEKVTQDPRIEVDKF